MIPDYKELKAENAKLKLQNAKLVTRCQKMKAKLKNFNSKYEKKEKSAKRRKIKVDPKIDLMHVSVVQKTKKVNLQTELRGMRTKYTKVKTKNKALKKENERLKRRLERRLVRFLKQLSKNDTKGCKSAQKRVVFLGASQMIQRGKISLKQN